MTPKQLLLWQQKVMICSSKKSGVIFFYLALRLYFICYMHKLLSSSIDLLN